MLIIAGLLILYFIIKGLNNNLVVTHYQFKTAKVRSKLRVVVLTDLHSCYYGENQNDLIKEIDKKQPDLVLLVGDIVDDKLPERDAYITLRRLGAKYPSFFVSGNHELYTERLSEIKQKIRNLGITVLSGEQSELTLNDNKIVIKGIDDPFIGVTEYNRQFNNLKNLPHDSLTDSLIILLAHRPERQSDYNQIEHDLVISGHAHGGQWRIPYLLPGIFAPHQGFFPKYTSGFYHLGNSKLLVGRGLSRENIKIPRFYNPPELIVLDIAKI